MNCCRNRILTLLTLAIGCTQPTSSTPESEVPGSNPLVADLGFGYRLKNSAFTSTKCVETPDDNIVVEPSADPASVETGDNFDFRTMKDKIDGGLSAGVSMGGVKVSAGVDYAHEMAADEYSLTKSVVVSVRGISKRYKDTNKIHLSTNAQEQQPNQAAFVSYCGDEFVVQKDYGGSLMAVLKATFQSSTDKERFHGFLDVAVAGVELSGYLEKMKQNMQGSVSISFDAIQIGGDPTQLPTIIDVEGLGNCSLENLPSCVAAYKKALTYASDAFPRQIKLVAQEPLSPTNIQLAPLRYLTSDFNQHFPGTISQPLSPAELVALRLDQETVQEKFHEAVADNRRARTMLSSFSLDEEKRQRIENVRDLSLKTTKVYATALGVCYGDAIELGNDLGGSGCRRAIEIAETRIVADGINYNRSFLSMSPQAFTGWCTLYRNAETLIERAHPADGTAPSELTPEQALEEARMILPDPERATVKAVINLAIGSAWTVAALDCIEVQTKVYQISELPLHEQTISSVEPLSSLSHLTGLDISGTSVASIVSLASIPNLEKVVVSRTKVEDLGPLAALDFIQTVELDDTKVISLAPLKGKGWLESVSANRTRISDLTDLEGTPVLTRISVEGNRMRKSIADFVANTPSLEFVAVTRDGMQDPALCGGKIKCL